jgi:hypothetical protein
MNTYGWVGLWLNTFLASALDGQERSASCPGRLNCRKVTLVPAQTVNRRLPTAAVRVQARVRSCGICGGKVPLGVGFLRVLRFLCQFSSHRLFYTHHLSPAAGTIGQLAAAVPNGLITLRAKKIICNNRSWYPLDSVRGSQNWTARCRG